MGITLEPRKENLLAASLLKNKFLGKTIKDIAVYKEKSLVRFILNDDSILDLEMVSGPGADGGWYQWLKINVDGKELLRT